MLAQRPLEFLVLTIAGCKRSHALDAYHAYGGCLLTQTGTCSFQVWLHSLTFKEPHASARFAALLQKKVKDGVQPRPETLVEHSGALAGGWHCGYPVVEEERRARAATYAAFDKKERYFCRTDIFSAGGRALFSA